VVANGVDSPLFTSSGPIRDISKSIEVIQKSDWSKIKDGEKPGLYTIPMPSKAGACEHLTTVDHHNIAPASILTYDCITGAAWNCRKKRRSQRRTRRSKEKGREH
jgi:hypothetical protein